MASFRRRTNRVLGRENGQGQAVYYVASNREKSERTSTPTVTREGPTTERHVKKNINWQQRLSLLLINLLSYSHCVVAFVGYVVEWTLNFLALNGSLWTLPSRCIFHCNALVFPEKGASDYHTLIWQLDPREDLYADTDCFQGEGPESRKTLDVTIMASKLVYENPDVIKNVVEEHWRMHYVGFYTCWNEYYKSRSTEAFIFADNKHDMKAIVIVWRGTEPFNTWDWSTDIDFSWAQFQDGKAVHLGFLEALGLCHRDDFKTFTKMDRNAQEKRSKHTADNSKLTKEEINKTPATSGLSDDIIANHSKMLAYDDITKIVAELLYDHPKARLFVTGHSLGGALAALYGAMLYYNAETEITNRLAAIYTFGQPRVGNQAFASYAHGKLGCRYKRVVYCNDIVPRVPFDNKLFQFKHFGECYYYDNWYNGMGLNLQDLYCDGWWLNDGADLNTIEAFYYSILPEEPERNFFGSNSITLRITAVFELIQCIFILPCRYGPEYQESAVSILARLAGIIVPEVVAHSPRNYVNAVRLGPCPLSPGTPKNLFQTLLSFICSLFTFVARSLFTYVAMARSLFTFVARCLFTLVACFVGYWYL